jgi:hypothetical protein
VRQEALALRGEGYATSAAREEPSADLGFQPADVAAERLLRHEQATCGSGEVKLLGDGHEGAQEAEIKLGRHAGTLLRRTRFTRC